MDVAQLQTKLREYKQEHLLQFWDTLTKEAQHEFYHQLNKYKVELFNSFALV